MVTVEIRLDEEVIQRKITDWIVQDVAKGTEEHLFVGNPSYDNMRKAYKEDVQGSVRKMLAEHQDEIINKAISEAARILANKGLPMMLKRLEG